MIAYPLSSARILVRFLPRVVYLYRVPQLCPFWPTCSAYHRLLPNSAEMSTTWSQHPCRNMTCVQTHRMCSNSSYVIVQRKPREPDLSIHKSNSLEGVELHVLYIRRLVACPYTSVTHCERTRTGTRDRDRDTTHHHMRSNDIVSLYHVIHNANTSYIHTNTYTAIVYTHDTLLVMSYLSAFMSCYHVY